MQIKVFDIISLSDDNEIEIVNKFIRGHKVIDIDKQFYISTDNIAHWSLFITYLPAQNNPNPLSDKKGKIDYKEILSEEDFNKFTKLRAIRKQLAENEAIPAYAVFSDAELALISQLPNIELSLIKKISGIGEKRIEKYASLICESYNNEN